MAEIVRENFSPQGGCTLNTQANRPKKRGLSRLKSTVLVLMILLICGQLLYLFCVYSNIPFIKKWRNIYINTAMTTYTHQWLATALLPKDMVDEVVAARQAELDAQKGAETNWGDKPSNVIPSQISDGNNPTDSNVIITTEDDKPDSSPDKPLSAQQAFFQRFDEIDQSSMLTYVNQNPAVLDDGWENININEAALYDDGTDIRTTAGDQVLAIDAKNGILLIRVKDDGYRGVLAIVKDSSMVSIHASKGIGSYGSLCKDIAADAGALLATNASAFYDPNGNGNGGTLVGYAVCEGAHYGYIAGRADPYNNWKRMELREDNLMYVVDSAQDVDPTTTDACEWNVALIVNGEKLVSGTWELHPRSAVGMSSNYEVMFLIIEGRQPLKGLLGTTATEVADILLRYDCAQAMLQDGGSSAIMVYHGEPVTMCSNGYETGRALPNAWVVVPPEG